jgi:hypothetical protein
MYSSPTPGARRPYRSLVVIDEVPEHRLELRRALSIGPLVV